MIDAHREFEQVAVVGLGYIGLPTAALIASRGFKVVGIDVNRHVVETVSSGAIHIDEPDLEGLVQKVVSSGFLVATNRPEPADVFIIAVPTPIDSNKAPDLQYVFAAVETIIPVLRPDNLLIVESTAPVGTTERIVARIAEMRPDLSAENDAGRLKLSVAYCPERVLPGRILTELVNNDRCIGGITPECSMRAQSFYQSFVRGACIVTSARAAEMVKLTENAFRDTNIAFANEVSLICEHLDINVWEVIELANRHPRVNILKPGPGVGGHCIAVDPWFLVHSAPDVARLIRTSREVNDSKIHDTVRRAAAIIDQKPEARVACYGLTFKANVDDLRESPALEVVRQLLEKYGDRLSIVEPHLTQLPANLAQMGAKLASIDDALLDCEIALLLVDHEQFKRVSPDQRRHLTVLDTRGIWQ